MKEVISFKCDEVSEINEELQKQGLDARDVISILEDRSHDCWYEVFYRKTKRPTAMGDAIREALRTHDWI